MRYDAGLLILIVLVVTGVIAAVSRIRAKRAPKQGLRIRIDEPD